jgi:hypothetical protein
MDPWNVCIYVGIYASMNVCMYELEYLTIHNRTHWSFSIPHILTISLLGNELSYRHLFVNTRQLFLISCFQLTFSMTFASLKCVICALHISFSLSSTY